MVESLELVASATFGSLTYVTHAIMLAFYVIVAITVVGAIFLAKKQINKFRGKTQ